MKRNEVLFLAIGGLESARLEATEVESKVSRHPKSRFLLVAALIALTLLLVGCAVAVYAKIHTQVTQYDVPTATVSTDSSVETVVLLSHKKADSYIHIDVEFGEGEGKIPVDSIAKRAEAYKPKEKVTYKMIKEYIEAKYGFKVHTAYIAEVKRDLGLPMYDAPNAVEELKQPRKHPTPEKVEAIKDALRYFAVI